MSSKPQCFTYFCQSCQEEHVQPLPDNMSAQTVLPKSCGNDYPVWPSAVVAIDGSRYMAALAAVDDGVRKTFFDGDTILLPETETATIAMLCEQFGGSVVYGQAQEYEFATKASKAGVPMKLLKLGQSVHDVTGQTADEMVLAALEHPSATLLAWESLYRSSMLMH
ncbi:hypothetical protein [Pseudomonas serbica]|uniref:hypothetical protein n=1 Tax=Pseudomonas serbica TaxID=2965074 RepID=UPI00237A188D|nr:hypothetical protein [Pseudomonas serbica]